jgi:hypothetical protein
MSEIARHQLFITPVHGTWPRGLFPRIARFKQRVRELTWRQRRDPPPPLWFEEGSPFLARLSTELGDIPHKIVPLLWSGENSIFKRDKTAHALAEHLSAEHTEHPQATQLVIAHSHGGNIALRALHDLHLRDASRSYGAESANPLVVTLATPFVEVHHADFGLKPAFVRIAVLIAIITLLHLSVAMPAWERLHLAEAFFSSHGLFTLTIYVVLFSLLYFFIFGVIARYLFPGSSSATARQNQVEALKDATRLGEIVSGQAQRVFIVRAIDDEASLVLALGTIVNYVTTRFIIYIYWIGIFFPIPLVVILSFFFHQWVENAAKVACCAFILILFGLLSVARTAHGRELALSPMECQINTQSAPDAVGLSKVVTLVRRSYVKSLRHGIYDHEDCAKTISDWVRSQVCAPPVRDETSVVPGARRARSGVSDADHGRPS